MEILPDTHLKPDRAAGDVQPRGDHAAAGNMQAGPWAQIARPDCSIYIDQRSSPLLAEQSAELLADAPYNRRVEGDMAAIMRYFDDLPEPLRADIAQLAERFMDLMQVKAVRVRFEAVTTNACKKMHADFTDLRLITSYAGPGTHYAPHGDGDCCVEYVPTGAVALFKGKLFGRMHGGEHAPCFHRSPPIEGTDQPRLVLVIDTPERDEFHPI